MKKKFLCSWFIVFLLWGIVLCGAEPKYVFLFIGDGMGKPHVDLARQLFGKLNMDQLPVRGSVSTVNAKKTTTDSAASGTAYACGVKTLNGRLGLDAEGKSVDSCAVLAKRQGRRAAILTTVGANNATPAAFYAHVMHRSESRKIMEQFPASGIDILCGSGIDGMKKGIKQEDFLSGKAYQTAGTQGNAAALDGKGILVIAQKDQSFFAMKQLNGPVFVYSKGTDNLAAYVKKSIELMQDCPKGFFMMAEGGHIDHGGHGNNGQYMLEELKKFDLAVGEAMKFLAQHPEETLIVVSADHHTGGLVLSGKPSPDYTKQKIKVDKKDSVKTLEEKLSAIGITCTAQEKADLAKASASGKNQKGNMEQAVRRVVDTHSGIAWKTKGHTSDEVYLFAAGCGADRFAGKQENSDVGAKMKAIFAK